MASWYSINLLGDKTEPLMGHEWGLQKHRLASARLLVFILSLCKLEKLHDDTLGWLGSLPGAWAGLAVASSREALTAGENRVDVVVPLTRVSVAFKEPPNAMDLSSSKRTIPKRTRGASIGATDVHWPVAGFQISADASATPPLLAPPATNTVPSDMRTACECQTSKSEDVSIVCKEEDAVSPPQMKRKLVQDEPMK